MSFSSDVKDELSKLVPAQRHCRIAEIAGIITMCAEVHISVNDRYCVKITTENISVARKFFTLLKKTFNINTELSVKYNMNGKKNRQYMVCIKEHSSALKVLQATELIVDDWEIREDMSLVSNIVIAQPCCKRAFLRGAFLVCGSISDPNKAYHFEIVCQNEPKAIQLMEIINKFGQDAKVVRRKNHYVTYLKEGTQIVDMLNIMEAHKALMELENVRILKEVRNQINRGVNCEAANMNKTINAAVKQIEDINYIKNTIGLGKLTPQLKEIAMVRLENPEAPLSEITTLLAQPLGKSGVNHRFKKIGEIADNLRKQEEYLNDNKESEN